MNTKRITETICSAAESAKKAKETEKNERDQLIPEIVALYSKLLGEFSIISETAAEKNMRINWAAVYKKLRIRFLVTCEYTSRGWDEIVFHPTSVYLHIYDLSGELRGFITDGHRLNFFYCRYEDKDGCNATYLHIGMGVWAPLQNKHFISGAISDFKKKPTAVKRLNFSQDVFEHAFLSELKRERWDTNTLKLMLEEAQRIETSAEAIIMDSIKSA